MTMLPNPLTIRLYLLLAIRVARYVVRCFDFGRPTRIIALTDDDSAYLGACKEPASNEEVRRVARNPTPDEAKELRRGMISPLEKARRWRLRTNWSG